MDKHYPAHRFAFPALILSNLFLALGPWMVRASGTGPVAAGFWRLALAIPVLVIIARVGQRPRPFRPAPAILATIFIGGLFFAADLALWHVSIHHTKLANATLFGNVSALLFPLYGFIIARSLPRPMQSAALLLAGLGGALLLGSSSELSARHLTGDLFAIAAGFFYTLYLVAVDRARRSLAPMPVLALSSMTGAIPLLVAALLLGERIMPDSWTALILLSLGSQVLGQGLLVYAVGHLSPLVLGLGLLTQPIVTAVIGWIVYDERLSAVDYAGAALICAALVLIRLPQRTDAR